MNKVLLFALPLALGMVSGVVLVVACGGGPARPQAQTASPPVRSVGPDQDPAQIDSGSWLGQPIASPCPGAWKTLSFDTSGCITISPGPFVLTDVLVLPKAGTPNVGTAVWALVGDPASAAPRATYLFGNVPAATGAQGGVASATPPFIMTGARIPVRAGEALFLAPVTAEGVTWSGFRPY